jgi:serine/threonine protein kinase/dipeptidyl aminopeptidase/acylaminoacyl peptidase
MPFASGARFGAFEVLERVGTGGMGEVYRARDTRLDRTVALKVIRASELAGPDRIARFKREARAISRLNHPHICALYDIGEQDGETFLVMEYVPGETLAQRLERGPLRIEEALRYGVQIAEALDAAHRNGVVHRDLKPSNVMLARSGVKLLDFGLAKLRAVDVEGADNATTLSLGLSEEGVILGSLPYMAPEQLEGKPVDARADLFALGAVLYEMVTGDAPFQGDSKASLIVAILSQDPVPPTKRQPLTPALLDRTIQRCLAKSPDERWQTAADLAAELRYIVETLRDSAPTAAPISVVKRKRSVLMMALAAALGSVVTLVPFVFLGRTPTRSLPSFQQLTFRRGIITAARVAPDRQTILYSASWEGQPYDLYLTSLGSHESRSLGLSEARLFGISPSNELAFMRGRQSVMRAFGTLARMPLAGGAPRELLENVAAADWTPDGELAVVRTSDTAGRVQIEFPIGKKVYESVTSLSSLRVAPAGDRVAFMEGNNPRTIWVVDRAGKKHSLSAGWWPALGLAWSPAGNEVWFTGSRMSPMAIRALSMEGRERLLAQTPDGLRIQDVFHDGRVLAVRDHGREGFACRAPDDSNDRDLSWFDGSALEVLSADGRTVVFGEIRGGGGATRGIYLRKTDGSPAVRLGDGFPEDLSADGKWVLTRSNGKEETWILMPVGVGLPRTLPRGAVVARFEANFLPYGKGVVFGGAEEGHDKRIYVQDLDGGGPRAISPEGVRTIGLATPDGRFVLGSSGGHHFLFSVDGGQSRALPFLTAEDSPVQWTPDGQLLYVVRASSWSDTSATVYQTMEAQIDKVNVVSGKRTAWKTLKPADPVGLETISDLYITPDGSAYCYGFGRTLSDLFVIDGVK